jgi:hypothetical protein
MMIIISTTTIIVIIRIKELLAERNHTLLILGQLRHTAPMTKNVRKSGTYSNMNTEKQSCTGTEEVLTLLCANTTRREDRIYFFCYSNDILQRLCRVKDSGRV